jgi:hypothetical protein
VGIELMMGAFQPVMMLTELLSQAHRKFGTFALADEQVETLLREVACFFDRNTVTYNVYAPALNLHGGRDIPTIRFPERITLRSITNEEFTRFYGRNPLLGANTQSLYAPAFYSYA